MRGRWLGIACRYESLEEVEVEVEAEHARSTQVKPENQILAELKQAVTIEVITESRKVACPPPPSTARTSIRITHQYRYTGYARNLRPLRVCVLVGEKLNQDLWPNLCIAGFDCPNRVTIRSQGVAE